MKHLYDPWAEVHVFSPGDHVLALLPVWGSPFQARFAGPYSVVREASDLNYLISTPDRWKSIVLCHVKILKPYFPCFSGAKCAEGRPAALGVLVGVMASPWWGEADGEASK